MQSGGYDSGAVPLLPSAPPPFAAPDGSQYAAQQGMNQVGGYPPPPPGYPQSPPSGSYASQQHLPPQAMMVPLDDTRARFDLMCARLELKPDQGDDLYGVLTTSHIVLLLDDSGSMGSRVPDTLSAPFARGGLCTRWSELEMLTNTLVDIVTSTTPSGLDVFFLDRPGVQNVTDAAQLRSSFAWGPRGGTPIIGVLGQIFKAYEPLAQRKRVLVVVITDGEPSDGTTSQLFSLLKYQRHPNIHVSLAEMSDDEDTMAFLDGWDQQLANFDNSDDFRMELRRVQQFKGMGYRFR